MKKTMLLMSTAILATAFLAACGPSSKDDGTITRLEQNGNTLTVCDFAKVKDTLNVPLSEWVEDCLQPAIFHPLAQRHIHSM